MFDKKKIPLYKRIVSYFHPVWLTHEAGKINPYLEVLYYKNRFQLATKDALYSDGDHYTPALAVANNDPAFFARVKTALILGTGLGSMAQVIARLGYYPYYTLVEIDKVILHWAVEYLQQDPQMRISPHCMDAEAFMKDNASKFDFIFIDIFDSRVVPDFVSSEPFLRCCHDSLNAGGRLAFNYIINDQAKWESTLATFTHIFGQHKMVSMDNNRVFIAVDSR